MTDAKSVSTQPPAGFAGLASEPLQSDERIHSLLRRQTEILAEQGSVDVPLIRFDHRVALVRGGRSYRIALHRRNTGAAPVIAQGGRAAARHPMSHRSSAPMSGALPSCGSPSRSSPASLIAVP